MPPVYHPPTSQTLSLYRKAFPGCVLIFRTSETQCRAYGGASAVRTLAGGGAPFSADSLPHVVGEIARHARVVVIDHAS